MLYFRLVALVLIIISSTFARANSNEQLANKLAQLKGQVVYLDFWASWCGPCRKSFPWMNAIHTKYKDQGFTIVSINVDKEQSLADKFLRENPINFTVIYDPKGDVAKQFKLRGMPSSYLIDRTGKVVSAHVGFFDKKQASYEEEIKQLIQK
jgi:thiol-disulfide isomerase/thioredoxin